MMPTQRLIELCGGYADGAGAVELMRARLCLLDWLGVTIAGAGEPLVTILAQDAEAGHGPRGQRLIGRHEVTGLRDAVLINGTAGHALDYDDGMPAMIGHPSVAILPALLALSVDGDIGGEQVLRAIVAGCEAAGRIGLMMGPDHYDRGFHCTGTIGAMAGTIASAYLLGLSRDCTVQALGLAGTRAAGLRASFGSDAKPLHAGWASLIALTSAQWAAKGLTGASDILGSQQGFSAPLSQTVDPSRGLAEGSAAFVTTVTFKAHAACAVTHPAIDMARAAQSEHGFTAGDVQSIAITIAPGADSICNIAAPRSGLELKFSVRAVVAMALMGLDTANPASFSDALAADADLQSLVAKTSVTLDGDFALGTTSLALLLSDGRRIERQAGFAFASDRDVLQATISAKFLSLADPVTGAVAAQESLAMVMGDASGLSARRLLHLSAPVASPV